eukprot:Skav201906  [mRNA]  locus=scaffold3992:55493:56431:- [translate_table: standard]
MPTWWKAVATFSGPYGQSIVDLELAPPGTRFEPWRKMSGFDPAIAPGFLTGAAPTADRLFHAGLVQSQQCRWCGCEKETIQHLAGNCPRVNEELGTPFLPLPEQVSLATHGIFEVPQNLLSQEIVEWSGDDLPPCQISGHRVQIWGDGSIVNADHFFSRTMGFALVDSDGNLIYKHGRLDPTSCSYKAELCALLAAVRVRGPLLNFVTDCQSLRDKFVELAALGYIPVNTSFAHWWTEIFAACGFGNDCVLHLTWIRAHQFDHGTLTGVDVLYLNNWYAVQKKLLMLLAPFHIKLSVDGVSLLLFTRHVYAG